MVSSIVTSSESTVARHDDEQVYCLRIELDRTKPLVWRKIEIATSATFWDLHVAIQDSFGWLDFHSHEFPIGRGVGRIDIGIPHEFQEKPIVSGWTVPISKYLSHLRQLTYIYDFGDDWHHTIHLEEVRDADGGNYPRCLAGENATPPEDCGGVYGFEELKQVLTKPRSTRYREMRDWLSNRSDKVYWPFDPNAFDLTTVQFTDAKLRLKRLLKNAG